MQASPRQLTTRAITTGFFLGALLAPCNIYAGLKTGFTFNMSIAAALLSYAMWNTLHHFGKAKHWGLLENNINQTSASAAASIISAGLVAPIPAFTLISGRELAYPILALWVFIVSFTGIITALAVRRQLIERDALPFPNGIATAETIKDIYGHGTEAIRRVRYLLYSGLIAAALKLVDSFRHKLPSLGLPTEFGFKNPANGEHVSWRALGLEIPPSLMYFGFGAIVGPRVGISLLIGTVIAWVIFPAELLARAWVQTPLDGYWYKALVDWLLWPGISLMVASALTSFALSMGRIFQGGKNRNPGGTDHDPDSQPGGERYFSPRWFAIGAVISFVAVAVAQTAIFDIPLWIAGVAFGLSFLLAIVAGRVSGETGIAPIGALGKITQVVFAVLAPGNTTANLMTANVTGGAAGQCSDLLHDLKTGKLIGANLRAQIIAQCFGILAGSLAGCAAYLVIIPDPQSMLLTEDWPAPAVLIWKTVAETLSNATGWESLPAGCKDAVFIAATIGIFLAVLESFLPQKLRTLVPSASSIGFAFILPPAICLPIFLGAMVRVLATRINAIWSKKYIIVIAAGLVAGESLAGVYESILSFFKQL